MGESKGGSNVLITQSGGPTPVFNRSLVGVVREVGEHGVFGRIYGAAHGLDGVLERRLLDLAGVPKRRWTAIARTPGAALGSSRRKLTPEEVAEVLDVLKEFGVRFWFVIGGNDTAETAHAVGQEAEAAGRPLTVLHVPKTIDNDLVLTDHTPGYGSAARFVALAAMGAGKDAEAMRGEAPVTILEVMGRDAGWLAAASALGKRRERDAPHVICVPEVPVDEDTFLGLMESAYSRFGFAAAVVAENARGADGVLGRSQEPEYVDDFGHPYYADGPGRYLQALVARRLGVRVRLENPGTIQRSMVSCVAAGDAREADMVGRAAVRYALEDQTDRVVTLVRESAQAYACTTGLAPLSDVAGRVRRMPDEYLDAGSGLVTESFVRYARPLVGPLPRLARLRFP